MWVADHTSLVAASVDLDLGASLTLPEGPEVKDNQCRNKSNRTSNYL